MSFEERAAKSRGETAQAIQTPKERAKKEADGWNLYLDAGPREALSWGIEQAIIAAVEESLEVTREIAREMRIRKKIADNHGGMIDATWLDILASDLESGKIERPRLDGNGHLASARSAGVKP